MQKIDCATYTRQQQLRTCVHMTSSQYINPLNDRGVNSLHFAIQV